MLPYQLGLSLVSHQGICQACHINPSDEVFLCADCQSDMVWLPPSFAVNVSVGDNIKQLHIQAATHYMPPMNHAIAGFKDREDVFGLPYLIHGLAHLSDYLQALPDDAVILPVPTTNRRLVDRGFSPVHLLARYLSAMTGFVLYEGVARLVDGINQRKLDRQARMQNVKGAFGVNNQTQASHIVLFDDVSTTGSTFASIAECLWYNDSTKQISAVCLAHGKAY